MVGGSLRVLPASSITKTDRHDTTEILLKVALNTKNQKIKSNQMYSHAMKALTVFPHCRVRFVRSYRDFMEFIILFHENAMRKIILGWLYLRYNCIALYL